MSEDVSNTSDGATAPDLVVPKPSPLPRTTRRRLWRELAFANSATRREAKAILFQELSVATAQGMPLDVALESAVRTEEDRKASATGRNLFTWETTRSLLVVTYVLFSALGSLFLLLLTSAWATDVERVARVLAGRLLPFVRAGHSLSDAMAMLPSDYTREEINTVRAGENWNNLPTALEKLGQFQYYEREMQRHWARMMYPLWLFFIMAGLIQFVLIFILPKFKDIYDQLGAELPGVTQLMVGLTHAITSWGGPVFYILLWLIMVVLTIRLLMVGNRTLRDIGAAILFGLVMWALLAITYGFTDSPSFASSPLAIIGIFVMSSLLSILIVAAILTKVEQLVLGMERTASKLFGNIPIIGAARTTEMESRWLAALSLGLVSGSDTPFAIQAAGDICGGHLGDRSRRAADLIRKGYSIGQAVIETRVLRPRYANRLRLLDDRPDYLAALTDISEDAARDSFHTMNRASRLGEVFSVCALGAATALFAFAMYMPLFEITHVVGVNY